MGFDSRFIQPGKLMIDVDHYEVHARNMFTMSKTNRTVANNHYVYYRIKPTTKECHLQINLAAEGKAYLRTYNTTTFPLVNVPVTPFNRFVGGVGPTTEIYTLETDVANLVGVLRGDDAFGAGGSSPQRVGGSTGSRLETIIPPGEELLIEVQNVRGSDAYIDMILNFYEQ